MSTHPSLSTRTEHAGTLYVVSLLRAELGRRIKVARLAADLTQQELAEKIKLKHAQDVSRYERGEGEVPAHRIDLIAEATGRPRSYFTRDPSEPEPIDPEHIAEVRNVLAEVRADMAAIVRLLEERLPGKSSPPPDEGDEPRSAAQ